jgi:integrase
MGIGSIRDFSLREARERANEFRQKVADKIDPIEERDARAKALAEQRATEITFKECAERYHAKEATNWKNVKHAAQWINTLRTYAFPMIGNRRVHTVGKSEVLAVLEPIWNEKPETASRVRQRINAVLDWAAATDLNPGYSSGMWAQIDKSLGKNKAERIKTHHAACPYREVGAVLHAVRASQSTDIVKLAFEFTVLTAARSGETRGARWSEVNLRDRLWVIPASRMKAEKEHRVPLSDRCVELLGQAKELTGARDLIFCNATTAKPFSDAVFTSLIHKGLGLPYTMHGFRSSFRDWGGEKTNHARELLEISLAHLQGDSTEQAYSRGDALEKRLPLMQDWAIYATTVHDLN